MLIIHVYTTSCWAIGPDLKDTKWRRQSSCRQSTGISSSAKQNHIIININIIIWITHTCSLKLCMMMSLLKASKTGININFIQPLSSADLNWFVIWILAQSIDILIYYLSRVSQTPWPKRQVKYFLI